MAARGFPFLAFLFIFLLLAAEPARTESSVPDNVWERGPSNEPDHFPIGVWHQDPVDAKEYRSLGINLYVGLNGPVNKRALNKLKIAKMPLISPPNEVTMQYRDDPIIVGWLLPEEPDEAQGNESPESDSPVPPADLLETYQTLSRGDPSRPVLANFGQGVVLDDWPGRGDRRNKPEDYLKYVRAGDILSFNFFPVSHPDAEVRGRLSDLAKGVERLRVWSRRKKPVWPTIECTRLSSEGSPSPAQVEAMVWMSIIHGAEGIIYFPYELGEEIRINALLADPWMRETIPYINKRVLSMATVLNRGEELPGVVAESEDPAVAVAARAKRDEKDIYIFAVCMQNRETTVRVSLPSDIKSQTAVALDEEREIAISEGKFSDRFNPYEVHIYRVGG